MNDFVLTINGRDFGANDTNTQVLIDETEQTVISGSDTELKVQITSMINQLTMNVDLFLPIGIPEGLEELTMTTGITLIPKFLSINTHTGSPGGTLITA